MINGEYSVDKFIISKTLKASYKNPDHIAHKALADRIGIRDPGNKPLPNDRLAYIIVVNEYSNLPDTKQKDIIETVQFANENNLPIDYVHYITNQIMVPAGQIMELMMDKSQIDDLFNKYITIALNRRYGRVDITKLMGIKTKKKKTVVGLGKSDTPNDTVLKINKMDITQLF
jgi:DNA polymerase elongation subunit (family B)